MSRSGLRFLAVRSGGCSHNLVDMRVEPTDVAQDAAKLAGGGGPEGVEHLWIKGRLYKIAKSIGAEAVIEHSLTHADVLLPEHNLALEYQRWNTDFVTRTEQRTSAGAARTIWMFPSHLPKGAPSVVRKRFDEEVFQYGGIYVSVLNEGDDRKAARPWEDASQERTARLYASGSIAVYNPHRQALVRTRRSLATILAEIIRGDRVLEQAVVWKKSEDRRVRAWVWALRDDLACAEAAQEGKRRTARPLANKPSMPAEAPSPELSADLSPGLCAPAHAEQHSTPALDAASTVDGVASTPQPPRISPHAQRRSWWKAVANWFR